MTITRIEETATNLQTHIQTLQDALKRLKNECLSIDRQLKNASQLPDLLDDVVSQVRYPPLQ
jgi:prefoldin subunit 5